MQKEEYYRCPECKGKKLTEWNPRYRKCPKCNGRMLLDKTEYPMLWDQLDQDSTKEPEMKLRHEKEYI